MPKFGDARADGFVFRGLQRSNGKTYEQWVSPKTAAKRRAYAREWRRADYKANPDKHREKSKRHGAAWRRANPVGAMLIRAKARAKDSGLLFSITAADVQLPEFCPVFGVRLVWCSPIPCDPCSAELDRIDNSLGYVPGNVIVVSRRANQLKSDATIAELEVLAHFYSALCT